MLYGVSKVIESVIYQGLFFFEGCDPRDTCVDQVLFRCNFRECRDIAQILRCGVCESEHEGGVELGQEPGKLYVQRDSMAISNTTF